MAAGSAMKNVAGVSAMAWAASGSSVAATARKRSIVAWVSA